MFIVGYRRSALRTFVCWLCIGLTLGLLRLFMHWRQHWLLLGTHAPCSLDSATKVLVKESFQGKHSVFYVKDIVGLNSEMMQKIMKSKSKMKRYKNFIPLDAEQYDPSKPFLLSIQFADGVFKREYNFKHNLIQI